MTCRDAHSEDGASSHISSMCSRDSKGFKPIIIIRKTYGCRPFTNDIHLFWFNNETVHYEHQNTTQVSLT